METDKRAEGSLGRRVQQMVKEPLDSETVRKALEALTESYHKTSVENGLGGLLRGDLRMEMLKQKQEEDKLFVKALSQVKEAFTQVENNVVRLDEDCDELRRRINTAQQATAGIASQAGLLSEEKEELIVREKLANMFATRFSLTEREMEILGSDTLDDEYFLALDRVAEARSDCQKLLSVKKQTAADDLLLELTQQEEYAFNTLLRWVQSNIRTLNRKHSFKMLGKALSRLQPHQALFDVAMAEFGRVRADIVGSAFLIALVRGGEGGIPRPIETHAADPLRYVGDMLAWLHQTCASEKELLEMMEIGTGLVSDTLAGVARPLEIRIRQTLAAINDPIVVYNIHSILSFYARLLAGELKESSLICKTVEDLTRDSSILLQGQLENMLDASIAQLHVVSPALRVPENYHALLAVVAEITRQYNNNDDDFNVTIGLQPITTNIVELLQKLLDETHLVIEKSKLLSYEQTMLELNVLWTIKQEVFVAAACNLGNFAETIELMEQKLADELSKQLLEVVKRKSNLPFDFSQPLSRSCLENFNLILQNTSQDLDPSRMLSRLLNHLLARNVALKVSRLFVENYRTLFNHITESHSDTLKDVLLSPETVSTLL